MRTHPGTVDQEAEISGGPQALTAFIARLAEIVPSDRPITSQSHLVEDLELDALAFRRLGILMYQHYGIGGVSPASLRAETVTVEGFFQHCILNVLGVERGAE
jgi:hypothetical protein